MTGGIETIDFVFQVTFFILRHVITAAHCLKEYRTNGEPKYQYDDITVILGKKIVLMLRV